MSSKRSSLLIGRILNFLPAAALRRTRLSGYNFLDGLEVSPVIKERFVNSLLWVLQVLAALMYGASGMMKTFMFDEISKDVPSFGALPKQVWLILGVTELLCVVGLILPGLLHWQPKLTVVAALILAIESLVFVGVHLKYREVAPIIMCIVLGLLMAFIAYGRSFLKPLE